MDLKEIGFEDGRWRFITVTTQKFWFPLAKR
jgi:hypothetical protein